MAVDPERVGFDNVSDRALFRLSVDSPGDMPQRLLLDSRYFSALLVWDARNVPAASIASLARILLDAGCVYFCCWGPDCERVHDTIDEEYARNGISINDDESTIMTTWHTDDSLEEAAWFCLNVAFPDDRFFDECKTVLAVCVGSDLWAEQLDQALRDTRALNARVVEGGTDAA